MRYILLIIALLLSPLARADFVYSDEDGDTIRLGDSACTNEQVLKFMPENIHADLKAGYARLEGKDYQLCWRPLGHTTFYIRYDDGDMAILARRAFRDDSKGRT